MIQKPYTLACILLFLLVSGCKKNTNDTPVTPPATVQLDAEKVTASVNGFVLDETNKPVFNALVTCGGKTTKTNSQGMFNFSDVSISKRNGFVVVEKSGYFKGIRSFSTADNGDNHVRIQLMQKNNPKSFAASTGGTVTSNGGATIIFPANAFVTAAGSPYSGTVTVTARWIDPTAANLSLIIPGDLRGIDTTQNENALQTFGMIGAELEDGAGNKLSLAAGAEATINLPLPAAVSGTAPATIPLWHFDETAARWIQEGIATKSGSSYVGKVKKFSFWNCDMGLAVVKLGFTAVSSVAQLPLTQIKVRISATIGSSVSVREAYVNALGYLQVGVPANCPLKLELLNYCGVVMYTQNIAPLNTNTNLGTITVNPGQYVSVTGTVTDCSSAALANGYVSFTSDILGIYIIPVKNGVVNFAIPVCTLPSNAAYSYQAANPATNQLSSLTAGVCTGNSIVLGTVNACGNTVESGVYVGGQAYTTQYPHPVMWKDGTMEVYTNGGAPLVGDIKSVFVNNSDCYAAGRIYPDSNNLSVWKAALWKNGVLQPLENLVTNSYIYGVCVDKDNNVWAAGNETAPTNKPVLWKNGVKVIYNSNAASGSYFGVATSGSDVYVLGEQYIPPNFMKGYWKNGVFNELINANSANCITVSGSDVYIGGATYNGSVHTGVIWKNGVPVFTTAPFYDLFMLGIAVVGTDVYSCGYQMNNTFNYFGVQWKNGVLTNTLTESTWGFATGMATKNNDIYVCGYDHSTPSQQTHNVKYWKNSQPYLLTNQYISTEAHCIFVK